MQEYLELIIIFLKDNYNIFLFFLVLLVIGITGVIIYLSRKKLKENWFPFFLFFFVLIFLIAVFGGYFTFFKYTTTFPDFWPNLNKLPNRGDWGTLGDYVGGILNPFFSFLSLLLLLVTIIIHLYELRKTRKTIKKSAKHQKMIAKNQEKINETQSIHIQIESRKNSLNATKNSVIVRIPVTINNIATDKLINYPHSFEFIFDVFRKKDENDNSYQDNYSPLKNKELGQIFRNFNNDLLQNYGITLENYISAFFSLLNHIDYMYINTDSSHIKKLVTVYVENLRDNLTPYEAAIIFYAPIGNNYWWKKLLEKYGMLRILVYKEHLIPNEHRIYYKSSAFNSDELNWILLKKWGEF
ncbi:hypothetical protein QUF74_13960 [Candidatus Halobeggiatoa sp. HSG11]|nr:hypothetical protein [Candidatus Halobeggiatoa sp. HSG11]